MGNGREFRVVSGVGGGGIDFDGGGGGGGMRSEGSSGVVSYIDALNWPVKNAHQQTSS